MNTAVQCIILLAITAFCTSATMKRCRCLRWNKIADVSLIADANDYGPRPYCNKREVIVTMKNNRQRCLDPEQEFTKSVLQIIQLQRASRAANMNTDGANATTVPAPVSTIVASTSP